MFSGNTQMADPRDNPVSSTICNQQMNYHNAGWTPTYLATCSNVESSGYGIQNYNSDYKSQPYQGWSKNQEVQGPWNNQPIQGTWNNQPTQGTWNNQPIQGTWNNQPTQGTWNNQPTQCTWNNQPTQCTWNNQPPQCAWNNHANRGSWNMGNGGGQMMRGPPPRGGRSTRARGVGGSGRFSGPVSGDHYCDSCDRGFATPEDLINHQKYEHIICGLEGCTLSAHPKIVEKHQRMQHDSGLYSRLAAAASQNPDDVEKWVKERKRNYPTKENIERRKLEAEECLRRGEPLGLKPESRFGRYRGRGGHNFRGRGQSWQKSDSHGGRVFGRGLHKRKFDGRGGRHQRQTRGRRMKKTLPERGAEDIEEEDPRDIPMFPGTACLLGVELDETSSSDEEMWDVTGSFSDAEWMGEKEEGSSSVSAEKDKSENDSAAKKAMEVASNVITLNNALGALMGMYASDDGSDEDAPPVVMKTRVSKGDGPSSIEPKAEEQVVDKNAPQSERQLMPLKGVTMEVKQDVGEESDGSVPEEVPIVRVGEVKDGGGDGVVLEGQGEAQMDREEGKEEGESVGEGGKRTKRSRKRTRGRRGNSEVAKGKGEDLPKDKCSAIDVKKPVEQKAYVRPTRHPTLLEELLRNEIRHERNVILQCIRHIVQSNFFDPVPVVQLEEKKSTTNEEQSLLTEEGGTTAD